MGRAYEVRKASIQKTGAAKAKLYSMYAKEIYQAAKNGGTDTEANPSLKRLIEKAKKEQVPSDIIKRAVEKVNSGAGEDYINTTYELFGPGGSTIIVSCLTDNVNRSISDIRAVVNKCHIKLGGKGTVSYTYEHLCIVGFKGLTEEQSFEIMLKNNIDIVDIEINNNEVIIYGHPQDLFKIKEVIINEIKNIEFDLEEIDYIPKDKIKLQGENLTLFNKTLSMLDEVDDVNHIYHNVDL